eukprot:g32325.t1
MYAQAVRRCASARLISRAHKVVQNDIQAQSNAICALKTNCNIAKPADKGGAIVIQTRTDYCKEAYQQLNNQEHYRQLPSILCTLILQTSCAGDFFCLPKIHKTNTPECSIISGNGTLCVNLTGYADSILEPIVQGTPSFYCYTADFLHFDMPLQKNTMPSSEDRHRIQLIMYPTFQYFREAEKLHHVLRSLQHVIDDDDHLAKIIPTNSLVTFKQTPNLKQTIVCSKLPSLQDNMDHNTRQPCHGNLCNTCQIIDINITIT